MSELFSKLKTLEDLEILKGEIDRLENALYQTNVNYNDILKNDIRDWVSEVITRESKEVGFEKYLEKIKKDLISIPVLSASVSFEPSTSFIEKLSLWLKSNISSDVVVDLLLNTQIIGGIQMSFKGKYLDLSLRKKISKELENITLSVSQP